MSCIAVRFVSHSSTLPSVPSCAATDRSRAARPGRRGFTQQPENSKRAHFSAPVFGRRKNEISGGREKKKREILGGPGEGRSGGAILGQGQDLHCFSVVGQVFCSFCVPVRRARRMAASHPRSSPAVQVKWPAQGKVRDPQVAQKPSRQPPRQERSPLQPPPLRQPCRALEAIVNDVIDQKFGGTSSRWVPFKSAWIHASSSSSEPRSVCFVPTK